MNKSLIVLLVLVCSISAFQIFKNKESTDLQAINWPFNLCGNGEWNIEKLLLGSTPKRDSNNDIDVVRIF